VTDNERIAYLAGQPEADVDPSDRAELDDLRALLAEPAVLADPDPALEERVVAAISEAAPPNDRRAGDHGAARRRRSTLARAGGLLAAAAIVVALVLVLTNARTQPVRFRAALAGTALSPGASGEATLTKTTGGWRVNLHATGLPRLANGRFYEAWLKNAKGVLVPIGTFNQPTNITLWAGVPPTEFPTLTVTRQLANGNPASSGERVLVGRAKPVS
jgi:anti-sigma-K factor RskA